MTDVREMEATIAAGLPDALAQVRKAIDAIMTAESHLQNAASKLFETPEDDRLTSLAMSLEDLEIDVRRQMERMKSLA